MRKEPILALLLSMFIFCSIPGFGQDVVNGYNATLVEYPGGSFSQDAAGTWKERTQTNVWSFKVTGKDEWSVYLFDANRKMSIQIDLFKKEIYLNWEKPDRVKLYNVTKVLGAPVANKIVPDVVNGYSATLVEYSGGSFSQDPAGAWKERTATNVWTFKETGRDEWSVYLLDVNRNMSIQLDLAKKEIYLNWGNPDRVKLYNVVKALAGPVGYTKIAAEDQSYSPLQFVDVAYGANGKFKYKYHVRGPIKFDNATFGDPAPGVVKAGYYKKSLNQF